MVANEATFDHSHEVLLEALLSSVRNRKAFEVMGYQDGVQLLNVAQFAILFNFDLSCLLRDLRARRRTWHVKLHARHLVLTMFECVDDFLALLGKDFRSLVVRLTRDPEALVKLGQIHRRLRLFQEQHKNFESIRHNVAAHRDHNAARQIELLENLDDAEVERASYVMIKWLTDLHGFTKYLVEAAGEHQRKH